MGGAYQLLRRLGAGGFGTVYLALEARTQRQVAIKFLDSDALDDEARRRFGREARLLYQQLHNPHVVTLLDHDLDCERPFIVLEYCEEGSLRRWVGQNKPWQEVATAVGHALIGLSELHSLGGFHRDIKPDNLLLGREPASERLTVKVADFGLARHPITGTGPMSRSQRGTDGYIAPEVLGGVAFTVAADVYSLGVTAIELLTGCREVAALASARCPGEFAFLLRGMVAPAPLRRPPPEQIAARLHALLLAPRDDVGAPTEAWWVSLWAVGGALAGLALLSGQQTGSWDSRVQRYRAGNGRFTDP